MGDRFRVTAPLSKEPVNSSYLADDTYRRCALGYKTADAAAERCARGRWELCAGFSPVPYLAQLRELGHPARWSTWRGRTLTEDWLALLQESAYRLPMIGRFEREGL
jgi:hypothetical protein